MSGLAFKLRTAAPQPPFFRVKHFGHLAEHELLKKPL